ncbi:tRNA (cytidine(34)-2'-O)-methyltransferase [Proteiniclasticum sp. SCR006]|uniref:Putative tRNA (cytidine(34)-2'-O)-methyltransferase n=1 Tax=Proteiniclasticum aestuarii TaxID=2817862 RepID=A0A939HE04_9CLOT|nr:tRNA (cytidine(34)-2'-O)-methyltransferase [Proteiniclasticum aestuarii]MBO1266201.1 tRNA (cytidine(34)-2'-O)-methyltransferase [Proteiniclasticum aestuarii]
MINIVLFRPEIPQNTGNIGRTCVLTNAKLHLIGPMGFSISDKTVARAGLDYWDELDVTLYGSYEELREKYKDSRFYFSSTKGVKRHSDIVFEEDVFIVFGRESSGLPEYIMEDNREQLFRVPMAESSTRSLNLSNTVAIVAYEALRQLGYPHMK